MSEVFLKALEETLKFEGGYVDDPDDAGGETNFGITVATARANGYHGPMREIPTEVVRNIYEKRYWDEPNLKALEHYMPELATYLFDIGVNRGPAVAVKMLQDAINRRAKVKIASDGVLGERTIDALWSLPASDRVLIRRLVGLDHGMQYLAIIAKKPSQAKYLAGWLKRVRMPNHG